MQGRANVVSVKVNLEKRRNYWRGDGTSGAVKGRWKERQRLRGDSILQDLDLKEEEGRKSSGPDGTEDRLQIRHLVAPSRP